MTHHQRQFRPDPAAPPLSGREPGSGLGGDIAAQLAAHPLDRNAAIACILSASEGWRDAAARLGGAFAPEGVRNPWLTSDEEQ